MNYRNAKYTPGGRIDCEIEHPDYGWIPTTLAADDAPTAELFAEIAAAGTAAAADPVPLATIQSDKLGEMNRAAAGEVAGIRAQYPDFERETWPDQEREARAWTADSTAATPTLSGIAAARGVTVGYLAPKVIAKADEYRTLAAAVAGYRQAQEDAIYAATTAAEVEVIAWAM